MSPVNWRPRISWSELRSVRVGVWGIGVEGRANLRRLVAEGAHPVVVDDRPTAQEVQGFPVTATAAGGLERLARCDVVIKTPGISRYRPEVAHLEDRGVAVTGGLALWIHDVDPSQVACVTGTKGKSTTVALCGHLLERLGYDAAVGGNLGSPPYDTGAGRHSLYVVETSSFQATDFALSPPVVAVTSLHPDHLDWHGDAATYFADKLSLTTQPGADLTIAVASETVVAHRHLLGPRRRWMGPDHDTSQHWIERLGLVGRHNRSNALVAQAVLQALGIPEAGDQEALAEAARGFSPLESRLVTVGTLEGVTFIDDSLSTNVLPALAALESQAGQAVALIAGGFDRGVDYAPLARALLAREEPTMVVTLPQAGQRVAEEIERLGPGGTLTLERAVNLGEAVEMAWHWARPQGVVLLSPAAPSFGQFRDYRERSAAFKQAMAALAPTAG